MTTKAVRLSFVPNLHFRFQPRQVLGAEIGLALLLALYHLGHQSFWVDETLTVAIVKLDSTAMWKLMAHQEANMGAYYVLMHLWAKFGDSEFYLRSFSVIFALASIPMTYLVGSRLFGSRVGLIAALLMATNAFWLHYAQEARAYSLLLFLSLLTTFTFILAIQQQSWNRWFLFSLTGSFTVYVHLFATLLIASLFVSLVFLPRRETAWRKVFGSAFAIAALLVPLAIFVITARGQLDFVPPLTVERAAQLFSRLAGDRFVLVAYFIACSIAALATLRLWRKDGPSIETWRRGVVITGLLLPIGVTFALSPIKPVVVPRYFIVCLPPLVLLVSLGLSQLRNPTILAGSLAIIVIASLFADSAYYSSPKQEWRQATSYILASNSGKDAIVFFHPSTQLSYDYYLERFGKESQGPRIENYAFASGTPEALRNPLDLGFSRPPDPDEGLGARLAPDYEQVWLVLSINHDDGKGLHLDEDTAEIEAALGSNYVVADDLQFNGIEVLRYTKVKS